MNALSANNNVGPIDMRSIPSRILLFVVLTIVCLSIGYVVGNRHGRLAVDREWDKMALHDYLLFSQFLKDGDSNRLEHSFRSLIVLHIAHYDKHFGNESVTDDGFIKDLAAARAIGRTNRAAWAEWSQTNLAQSEGGANGQQQSGSEVNSTSSPAASRRSP